MSKKNHQEREMPGSENYFTEQFKLKFEPNYIVQNNEESVFRAAYNGQIPLA